MQPGAGLGWLIVFRMVQAVGGSMLNPVAMSIITNTFTDRATRPGARRLGRHVRPVMALGPVLGGLLVESVGWRGVFWVNIPVVRPHRADRAVRAESRAPTELGPTRSARRLSSSCSARSTYAIIEGPN